jgi:DNA (cytosine-5)-methyltransferase 1
MWPEQRRLIDASRPRVVFGEQVASAQSWFDRLCADMAALGYEIGAAILPACGFGFDHARPRIVFVGHTHCDRQSSMSIDAEVDRLSRYRGDAGDVVQADGLPDRVAQLSGFGNAIVPQVAAEAIAAYMEIAR